MDGIDLGDVNLESKGDKNAQGMMYMGCGWIPVAIDGSPIDSQFDPVCREEDHRPKGTKTIDQLLLDKIPALTGPLVGGALAAVPVDSALRHRPIDDGTGRVEPQGALVRRQRSAALGGRSLGHGVQ